MTDIPFIMLDDKNSDVPLYQQIYEAMRRAILNGEFESGKRLSLIHISEPTRPY